MKPGRSMSPLWLDYQRPPPGRQMPGIVLLVSSLLLAIFLIYQSIETSDELGSAEQQFARLRQSAERQRLFASAEQRAARNVAAETTVSLSPSASHWQALFSALESASNDDETLLSLVPGQREIVITGEARGLSDALDYAQRLQGGPVLARAYLAKYEVIREHPRQPVRFTVLADWREAAR